MSHPQETSPQSSLLFVLLVFASAFPLSPATVSSPVAEPPAPVPARGAVLLVAGPAAADPFRAVALPAAAPVAVAVAVLVAVAVDAEPSAFLVLLDDAALRNDGRNAHCACLCVRAGVTVGPKSSARAMWMCLVSGCLGWARARLPLDVRARSHGCSRSFSTGARHIGHVRAPLSHS